MVADGKPPSDDGSNQKRKHVEAADSSSKPTLLKKPRLHQSAPIVNVKTRRVKRTNEEKARQANPFSQPGFLRNASAPTTTTLATGSINRSVSTPAEVIEISSGEEEPKQQKKTKKKKPILAKLKKEVLDVSSDSDSIANVKKPRPGPSKAKKNKPPPSNADIIELSDSDDAKPVKKEPLDPSPSARPIPSDDIPPLPDDFGMDIDTPAENSMNVEPLPLFLPSPLKGSPSPHATTPLLAKETSSRTAVHDDILLPSLTRIASSAPAVKPTALSSVTPDNVLPHAPVVKNGPPSTTPVTISAPVPVAPVSITSLTTAAGKASIQPAIQPSITAKPSSPTVVKSRPSLPDPRPPRSSASTESSGSPSLSMGSPTGSPKSPTKPRPSLPSVSPSKPRPSLPDVGPSPSRVALPVSGSGRTRPSIPDPGPPPASAPPVQRSLPSLPDASKPRRSLPHPDPPPSSAPPLSGRPRPSLPDPGPPALPMPLPSSLDSESTTPSPSKTPSSVKKPNIGGNPPRFGQTARKSSGLKRRPSYPSESPERYIDFRHFPQDEPIKTEKVQRSSSNIAEVIAAAGRSNAARLSDASSKHHSSSSSSSSSRHSPSVGSASSHSRKLRPSLPSGSSPITNAINEAGRRNASPLSALVRNSGNKPFTSTVDALNEASRLNTDSASLMRMDKPRSLSSSGSSSMKRSLPKATSNLPGVSRPLSNSSPSPSLPVISRSTSSPRRTKVIEVVPESETSDDGMDWHESGDSVQPPTMTALSGSSPMSRPKNPNPEAKGVSRSSSTSGSSKPDSKRMDNVNRSVNVAHPAQPQDVTMADSASEATLEDLDQEGLLDESAILNALLRDSTPSSVADEFHISLPPSDASSGDMPLQTPLTALAEATADLSISQQASSSPPSRPRKNTLPQSASTTSTGTTVDTAIANLSISQASSSPPRTPLPLPKRPRGRPRKHPLPQPTASTTSKDTLAPTANTVLRGTSPLEYMSDDEAERLLANAQDRLRDQAAPNSASTARKRTSLEADLSQGDTNSDEDSPPIRPRTRSQQRIVKSPSPTAPRRRSSRGASSASSASAPHSRANSVERPRYESYSETPEDSPLRSESPGEEYHIRYIDGVAIYTWKDQKALLAASTPKVYWAKNIPTALHDKINAMSDLTRNLQPMREVLKGVIREQTSEDEPDAPEIDIVNNVDAAATPPWEFYYSNRMWFSDKVEPPTMKGLVGCDCVGACDPKNKNCACLKRQQESTKEYVADFAYSPQKRLKAPRIPIFECNALCRCDDSCRNRVVQAGRRADIRLEKTKNKGWGVFANNKITEGSYIGIYAGELLTEAEGESRGQDYNRLGRTYLFNLDFWHLNTGADDWDNKYVVDAFHAGNFTRFLNHSCEPNCHLTACYINDPDLERPLLTLFALKDIQAGQELTFSYGGSEDDDDEPSSSPKKREDAVYAPCLCGAAKCKKKLFM